MADYITVSIAIEIICLFVAAVCLFADGSPIWHSMILYLFITCVAEIAGKYVGRHSTPPNNHWVYNIYLVCEIGFTNLMFAGLFKVRRYMPIIWIGLLLVMGCYVYELFDHGFFVYNNFTYTVMSVVFVFYSLYYYFLLIGTDGHVDLKSSPGFWWVAATLFFYFGNTACNLFDKQLNSIILQNGEHLSYYIFKALNVILYGIWSYSFICRKWLTSRSKRLSY